MLIIKCADSEMLCPESRGKFWANGIRRVSNIEDAIGMAFISDHIHNSDLYIKMPVGSNHYYSEAKICSTL